MTQRKTQLFLAGVIVAVVVVFSLRLGGGSLEPTGPPAPTMHSLDEIYSTLVNSQNQPLSSGVTYQGFLNISGIPGESTDPSHQGWIEVLSFQWGVGRGISAARSSHQDFTVMKAVDKASPKLAEACCTGQQIPSVELVLCPEGYPGHTFMNYKFTNVIVTSYGYRPAPTGDAVPTEAISLNYGKIEWTYTTPTGESVYAGWDVVANIPTTPAGPATP
jgi:type VI secretion system secreted protein Hcp